MPAREKTDPERPDARIEAGIGSAVPSGTRPDSEPDLRAGRVAPQKSATSATWALRPGWV